MAFARIKIIGIGNPLMGDDGIGIAAIRLLENHPLSDRVDVIDGGCGGLILLQLLEDCRHAIIVDAAEFQEKPGTIRILRNPDPDQLPENGGQLLSHQPGLPEVLSAARCLNCLPPLTLVLVQIETCLPRLHLSSGVQKSLPNLIQVILDEVAAPGPSQPRQSP